MLVTTSTRGRHRCRSKHRRLGDGGIAPDDTCSGRGGQGEHGDDVCERILVLCLCVDWIECVQVARQGHRRGVDIFDRIGSNDSQQPRLAPSGDPSNGKKAAPLGNHRKWRSFVINHSSGGNRGNKGARPLIRRGKGGNLLLILLKMDGQGKKGAVFEHQRLAVQCSRDTSLGQLDTTPTNLCCRGPGVGHVIQQVRLARYPQAFSAARCLQSIA